MNQLTTFKELLGNPADSDAVLQFYLDNAAAIICDIRNSNEVENIYMTHQIKMAIEMYNKRGAEGEIGHGENGLTRSYEKADISPSLLAQITPMAKTPFSTTRVVNIQ